MSLASVAFKCDACGDVAESGPWLPGSRHLPPHPHGWVRLEAASEHGHVVESVHLCSARCKANWHEAQARQARASSPTLPAVDEGAVGR